MVIFTRPEQKFREHIKEEPLEGTSAKKILKRDTASFDDRDEEVRETDSQRQRQRNRECVRETERETDRQTGRDTDRDTDRDRERRQKSIVVKEWLIFQIKTGKATATDNSK